MQNHTFSLYTYVQLLLFIYFFFWKLMTMTCSTVGGEKLQSSQCVLRQLMQPVVALKRQLTHDELQVLSTLWFGGQSVARPAAEEPVCLCEGPERLLLTRSCTLTDWLTDCSCDPTPSQLFFCFVLFFPPSTPAVFFWNFKNVNILCISST